MKSELNNDWQNLKGFCQFFLIFAAVSILMGLGSFFLSHMNSSPRIEEDDVEWNCKTMGNRICGELDGNFHPGLRTD